MSSSNQETELKKVETARATSSETSSEELTAAAALTSLVGASSKQQVMVSAAAPSCKDEPADEKDAPNKKKEPYVPQKLTKSGRQRAMPFPLKVCSSRENDYSVARQERGLMSEVKPTNETCLLHG